MKNVFRVLLSFVLLCGLCLFTVNILEAQVVVQDTTIVIEEPGQFPSQPTFSNVLSWLIGEFPRFIGLLVSIVSLFEIVVRVIPTNRDWSIFNRIIKFLESIQTFNPFKNVSTRNTVYKVEINEVENK